MARTSSNAASSGSNAVTDAASLPSIAPLLIWNLDQPMNPLLVRVPEIGDIKDMNGSSMKFFKDPIHVLLHAIVRSDSLAFDKVLVSIEVGEVEFYRAVEKKIMELYTGLLSRSDPSINLEQSLFTSATYQDTLFRGKLTKKTKRAVSVNGVQNMINGDVELVKGAQLLLTYSITGVHHSNKFHGLIGHIQSYVVVK